MITILPHGLKLNFKFRNNGYTLVRVRVRLGYTMAICLVLATPSKPPKPWML